MAKGEGTKARWRRHVSVAVFCLLGGGVVTVAVAWACLIWSPVVAESQFQVMGVFRRDGTPEPMPQTVVSRGFGVYEEVDGHIVLLQPRSLGLTHDARRVQAGWPLRAMKCEVIFDEPVAPQGALLAHVISSPFSTSPTWLVDGMRVPWDIPRAQPGRYTATKFVPLRPRPLGFLVNTLLAGSLLWFGLFGWREVRRGLRRRGGRCVGCGYPVAGVDKCPECGRAAGTTGSAKRGEEAAA